MPTMEEGEGRGGSEVTAVLLWTPVCSRGLGVHLTLDQFLFLGCGGSLLG